MDKKDAKGCVCKDTGSSKDYVAELEAAFAKLSSSSSKSLLKKYLTKEVFECLKSKKTSYGSTLLDCINSGVQNLDSGIGIYAADPEAYSVFAAIFDPIIEEYHGFKKTDRHPAENWGDMCAIGDLDPSGDIIVSTRVRCGRGVKGYPFNPFLTEEQYKEIEKKISCTLSCLEGDFKGTYYPLNGMTKEEQQKLIDDHYLFKEGDRFLEAAHAIRFWPNGRGIFYNNCKTFLCWINEEDHLRIISMQPGGDLGAVYRRLVHAVAEIQKKIEFTHTEKHGYVTFCPTNLGTTIRSSVHMKVPNLEKANKLKELATQLKLQIRGVAGEHTDSKDSIYDISNKRRLGLTEFEVVKEMYDGVTELIKQEKGAAGGSAC